MEDSMLKEKMNEIIGEIEQVKADMIVLTETKKKGTRTGVIGKYIQIYIGVKKDECAKKGVSIMINNRYKKNITNREAINENIVTVNINIQGYRISVVGVYGPSEHSKVEIKENHLKTLDEVISQIGYKKDILMLGDMNARVGRKVNHNVVG